MAEPSTSSSTGPAPGQTVAGNPSKKTPLHQLYALPAPIRTFPLPSFYPSNPLSLAHVVYAWLSQTIFSRPPNEPSTSYRGAWSSETRSVHITDYASIRALWEQGFFGKGSQSRSEPHWLTREMQRRGLGNAKVAEQITRKRREERQRAKWERARIEQEAIERTRLEETRAAAQVAKEEIKAKLAVLLPPKDETPPVPLLPLPSKPAVTSPVGPLQLLRLPNSEAERKSARAPKTATGDTTSCSPVSPLQLLRLPNSAADLKALRTAHSLATGPEPSISAPSANVNGNGHATLAKVLDGENKPSTALEADAGPDSTSVALPSSTNAGLDGKGHVTNGYHEPNGSASPVGRNGDGPPKLPKRQKSVRFSPEVKSTTFGLHDPPSPNSPSLLAPKPAVDVPNVEAVEASGAVSEAPPPAEIKDREHLQLSAQEAFYLSFAIGALHVVDPQTQSALSSTELLHLFADHSFFPPRISSLGSTGLRTDDPFLVHYVVYHHFRSLGWVPREGVKFGVDWLLYRRGPVFDHAEFGLLVIPSYSSAAWDGQERRAPQRQPTWHWLHGVQRVLSHVLKSLVLIYVDIPPPSAIDSVADAKSGISGLLGQYRVREVMVRRWSSNRNR